MSEVRTKITNNDPVSGKRMIAFLTGAPLGEYGAPLHVTYLVKIKETDEVTDAAPAGTSTRARQAVQQYEERFEINNRKISSTSRLYLPDDTQDPTAITLADYFGNKAINSFPGVSGTSPMDEFARGILREVILIRQANGELPV